MDDAVTMGQSLAFGYFFIFGACPVSFWSGDFEATRRHLSILLDVRSGITLNVYQTAGKIYERALDLLKAPERQHRDARDKLVGDPSLTPFLADNLSTFDSRLLCPQR